MTTGPDHTPLIDEQLSAWLDDELPGEELELLVTRLARSPEYQARLARYGMISSTLRRGLSASVPSEVAALQLASRVRTALVQPAGPELQSASVRETRVLPYAMAAGLALVAVAFAAMQGSLWRPVTEAVPAVAVVDAPRALVTGRQEPAAQAALSSKRLTNYLVYHGEYSGLLSARVTESHIVNNSPYAAELRPTRLPPSP